MQASRISYEDSVYGVRISENYKSGDIVCRSYRFSLNVHHYKNVLRLYSTLKSITGCLSTYHVDRNPGVVHVVVGNLHRIVFKLNKMAVVCAARPSSERTYLLCLDGASPFPRGLDHTLVECVLDVTAKLLHILIEPSPDKRSDLVSQLLSFADLIREGLEIYLRFVYPVLFARISSIKKLEVLCDRARRVLLAGRARSLAPLPCDVASEWAVVDTF